MRSRGTYAVHGNITITVNVIHRNSRIIALLFGSLRTTLLYRDFQPEFRPAMQLGTDTDASLVNFDDPFDPVEA